LGARVRQAKDRLERKPEGLEEAAVEASHPAVARRVQALARRRQLEGALAARRRRQLLGGGALALLGALAAACCYLTAAGVPGSHTQVRAS
jgi:hypothetical protein